MAQVVERHEDAGRVEAGVPHHDHVAFIGDARGAEDLDEILDRREFGDEIVPLDGDVVVLEEARPPHIFLEGRHAAHPDMQHEDIGVVAVFNEPVAAHEDVRDSPAQRRPEPKLPALPTTS